MDASAPAPRLATADAAFAGTALPDYAELHCRSNFSFLTGASHPQELVQRAADLGYRALALTDECSVAGVVRAHEQARLLSEKGIDFKLLLGASFDVDGDDGRPGCRLVLIARNREGWGDLCELITRARLRSEKGRYRIGLSDFDAQPPRRELAARLRDLVVLLIPRRDDDEATLVAQARWLRAHAEHAWLAIELLLQGDDDQRVARVEAAAQAAGLPIVACGDVLMHLRSRKPAQDVLTAIRLHKTVHDCGFDLAPNAEQHLRSRLRLGQLYRPAWLDATLAIAADCRFELSELGYEYPQEIVPAGLTPIAHLRALTQAGAQRRYPGGLTLELSAQIERELALIEELNYEAFFLTVEDVVRAARERRILCQGRGSAANSAVCYCLGITEVDPTQTTLLFERFVSRERHEPPDIDVDFEHERREEVIQYIYGKYGVERTALAAALSCYRTRSVVRDVGRALALDGAQIDQLANSTRWFDLPTRLMQGLEEAGLDPQAPTVRQWMELVQTLRGFPRHLSQHVGGFVIARDKLSRLVPIENAAMPDRRVIQWDKDDLESLGLLKVDVLALGMLSAIRRTLALMAAWHGRPQTMQDIPRDDDATYAMIGRADTIGVFQIESRAQMSMLPRLRPKTLYDLVIEVAIVRPGPIQGGMVHPYLQQREALAAGQPWRAPQPALEAALARTLGVPIFQEQVMQICVIAAGFTPGESDQLRRAMAAWRRDGHVDRFERRIKSGMIDRGYEPAFADAIFKQICGFGEYGFPESHAYSFALLAYISAWMKCHEPAAFLAGLLNSLPMGFYAPAQLVQDARRHGVVVRPPDVAASDWDCSLEADGQDPARPAVRLGLRMVASLGSASGGRIQAARRQAAFADVDDLARRAALDAHDLRVLAHGDALASLAGHRRQQLWAAAGQEQAPALLAQAPIIERPDEQPRLHEAPEGEAIVLDYASLGLSLRRHPLALLRARLDARGWSSAEQLARRRDKTRARACGIVTMRQQPETAKGVIFVTLEDETGSVNVIVWRHVREAHRRALLHARLLGVAGQWQRSNDGIQHLIARELVDLTPWLGALATSSRDFH